MKDFIGKICAWIILLLPLILIVIVLVLAYLVAVSDLPDWFKFFILH